MRKWSPALCHIWTHSRPTASVVEIEPYIEALANEVVHGSSSEEEEAVEYLRWVSLTQEDGKVGSGGLLLLANADGALRYAQLHDMLELPPRK